MCNEKMPFIGLSRDNSSDDPDQWRWVEDYYCIECYSSLTLEHYDNGAFKSIWVVG